MQFSFKRFCYLFKLQLAVNRKLYLLGIAALAGVLLVFMLLMMFLDKGLPYDTQMVVFLIGLLLSSGIFGAAVFKQFAEKEQRVQAIMLPASALECLLVAILFTLVIFPAVYMTVCLTCLWVINYIDVYWMGRVNAMYRMDDGHNDVLFILYFYLQAIVLVGAIWFRQYTFVKTAVMVCLMAIGLQAFNDYLGRAIIGVSQPASISEVNENLGINTRHFQYLGTTPYTSMRFSAFMEDAEKPEYLHVELPPVQRAVSWGLLLLVPFFLWFIAFLKLREQQL